MNRNPGRKKPVRVFLFLILHLLYGLETVFALELTSWDPWFFRDLERRELLEELPPGLQLSARPLTLAALGDTSQRGWQNPRTGMESSRASDSPYLENRRGAWITRGTNLLLQAGSGWISDDFSVWLEPRFRWSENREVRPALSAVHPTVSSARRLPRESGSISKLELARANILFGWRNIMMQAGYDTLRFGSGSRATLHWDSHAPPMPMLRIGTKAPWNTSRGHWSFSHQIGQLGKERTVPNSRISGWRLGWSTDRRFEFGFSRGWIVGLEKDQFNFYRMVGELYDPEKFFKPRSGPERWQDRRNQQLVTDGRLKFPETGTRIYWEWGREDHEHDFQGISKRWEHSSAKILGWHQQYGSERNLYTTLEWADTLQPVHLLEWGWNAWYNHQLDWTFEGVILGHPLGADGSQLSFTIGGMSANLDGQLTWEKREHGVRSHEQNPSSEEIEKQTRWELDARLHTDQDSLRLLTVLEEHRNPGGDSRNKFSNLIIMLAWNAEW